MDTHVISPDHYCVVVLEGNTIELLPGPIPDIVTSVKNGFKEIIIDLEKLTFLTPVGVKALRESVEVAVKYGARAGFAAPVPSVRRMLKLSGVFHIAPVYHSRLDAIRNLDLLRYDDSKRMDQADTLLVCHKDDFIALDLRRALRAYPGGYPHRMIPVRSLDEAFVTVHEKKVDCILIDVHCAAYKIMKFAELMNTTDQIPRIPMIVVTKDEDLPQTEIMIKNGANEILRYPFQPVEAVIRIQTLISTIKDHRPFVPVEKMTAPLGWR
jgi:CheY-like chemotaxis protein